MKCSYKDYVTKIRLVDFSQYKVLVLGAGFMGAEYIKALNHLGIKDISAVCATKSTAERISSGYVVRAYDGGYEKYLLNKDADYDLVIVAVPTPSLVKALECCVKAGYTNILVEKPCSLFPAELLALSEKYPNPKFRIRVAYNRVNYESFHIAKELSDADGGIQSCIYHITEWSHTFDFDKESKETFKRWGIANTSHVLSMAHYLIGIPKEYNCGQSGSLSWHPSGSIFYGSGVSEHDIPFVYFGNWGSAGRWGVEIHTDRYAYRMVPLEKLYRCKKGTVAWEEVVLSNVFTGVKEGVAEQIIAMLLQEKDHYFNIPTLEESARLTSYAEQVFGYDS